MNPDAEILRKVFTLTAGELEGKSVSVRPDLSLLSNYEWCRVTRISSFWMSDKPNETPVPLDVYVSDFISGMAGGPRAGPENSWAFLIHGYCDHIECWYGAKVSTLGIGGLRECLRGAFPDIRFSESKQPDLARISAMANGAAISGTPTLKRNQETRESREDQIEKVCRTLYGSNWSYLILAERHANGEVIQEVNRITAEVRNTRATHLLQQNAVDQTNRSALRYIDLLEKKLERWELGRVTGMWRYQGWLLTEDRSRLNRAAAVLQSAIGGKDSLPDPIRVHLVAADGLPQLITAPLTSVEMGCLASLPSEEYSGFEIVSPVRFGVETNQVFKPGEDVVRLGAILDRGEKVGTDLRIRRADLTKHGIIVGVTGAGKTNTCFALLEQVWDEGKGVPFLVIESAKSEYRALLKNGRFQGLRVFTVGDERISPIRLNPFQVPRGVLIQSHIDHLQALFGAAFVLYPPMPYVLAMSIQRVYEEKGWDLTHNKNLRGEDSPLCYPTLDDLILTVRRVADGMGYEGEIRNNIKAGLEGRLNQLRIGGGKGVMLNCRVSISDEELFSTPCILELKQLVSDEEKAFLIGLLLIRIYERYEGSGLSGDGTLKHVTLIEEAHRLLKNVSTSQGGDSANPQGKAIEVFANLLAEIRAFGEGIFMAEQIPTKLAPEALKNTNLKLIQRLVARDEREAVGSAMNLSEEQTRALSTLVAGQAVAFLEGAQKPVLCEITLSKTKKEYQQISEHEVRELMAPFWADKSHLLRKFGGCSKCPLPSHEGGCGRRYGVRASELEKVADQLLNTFLFYPQTSADAKNAFMRHHREVTDQPQLDYCFWVEFIDSLVSEWATAEHWPHAVTERLINALTEAYRSDPSPQPKSDLLPARSRPFVGCSQCPAPCQYRYHVAPLLNDKSMGLFLQHFKDGSGVGKYSLETTQALFKSIPLNEPILVNHAYCFAVQNFARSGLDEAKQAKFCQKFLKELTSMSP